MALNWSTVALPLPLKCMPCSVALRLWISSAPLPALDRLMVSLLAVTVTFLKSFAASCVQNGKPWMVTSGLPDRASDDWTWLAILFSAYALATRSLTTSSTTITSSVISRIDGPRLRRRRGRATVCGSAGPDHSCRHSGSGRVGSALTAGLPARAVRHTVVHGYLTIACIPRVRDHLPMTARSDGVPDAPVSSVSATR